ncbi:MAG: cell division protein FtsA [bacterium]|nr:cell division protein FtsA [bacterium]
MKQQLITGLDIGSTSMKMMVARKIASDSPLEIVAYAEEPSSGVRKGVVVNSEEAAKKIMMLKNRIESAIGKSSIDEVVVNIGGSHLFLTPSRGMVAVSRADSNISQEDIDRVLQGARSLSLPANKEVLEVYPRHFIVDGEAGIEDPIGMRGLRLEVEANAICAFSPYVRSLAETIQTADLGVADMMPSVLAAAESATTSQQRERGVALIELGAATTSVVVFEEGHILHLTVLPIGSANITHDIAIGLRTDPETAEAIKKEFGSCNPSHGKRSRTVEKTGMGSVSFSQKLLSHIIASRFQEIFQLVQKELKKAGRQGKLPSGVVLAGGGAKLPGVADLAKKEFKLAVRVGSPLEMVNAQDDPSMLVVAGLVRRAAELTDGKEYGGGDFFKKVKKVLKAFIP